MHIQLFSSCSNTDTGVVIFLVSFSQFPCVESLGRCLCWTPFNSHSSFISDSDLSLRTVTLQQATIKTLATHLLPNRDTGAGGRDCGRQRWSTVTTEEREMGGWGRAQIQTNTDNQLSTDVDDSVPVPSSLRASTCYCLSNKQWRRNDSDFLSLFTGNCGSINVSYFCCVHFMWRPELSLF